MADQNTNDNPGKGLDPNDERLQGKPRENDNEWLRDQMGEDHNLSGSSTYRTLPDQPGTSDKDRDSKR